MREALPMNGVTLLAHACGERKTAGTGIGKQSSKQVHLEIPVLPHGRWHQSRDTRSRRAIGSRAFFSAPTSPAATIQRVEILEPLTRYFHGYPTSKKRASLLPRISRTCSLAFSSS